MGGVVNDHGTIYLSSASVVDIKDLAMECHFLGVSPSRVCIDPSASILYVLFVSEDKRSVIEIGSTGSGTGPARAHKIRRIPGNRCTAASHADTLKQYGFSVARLSDDPRAYDGRSRILAEVAQGYGLSLNSEYYPYCTSTNISVAQTLADLRLHPSALGDVHMAIRTFPIRVRNPENGTSGPFPHDSVELSWEELGVEPETSTVTGRQRRIATFSHSQFAEACRELRPDYVFVNFLNYMKEHDQKKLLSDLKLAHDAIYFGGYGPTVNDIRRID
jgi:adenylosuccinate synthase